ncbi:hypothetical protein [Gordonia iterans]
MNSKRLITTAAVTATLALSVTACGDDMSTMNTPSSAPASSQPQMPSGHSMSSSPSSSPAPHASMPGMPSMPGMDHGSPSTSPAAP